MLGYEPQRGLDTLIRALCVLALLPMPAMALEDPARSTGAPSARRISEEALLFRRLSPGVVTVLSDEGHGTGFLVDSLGIVLTNQHVIGGSTEITILFDDSVRVVADILTSDKMTDVAALHVHPSLVRQRPILSVATTPEQMPFEGERVLAIGSPLNQIRILTTGVVSKVEGAAIISDINANPGNSGGPMFNLDGVVVGIVTFGDFSAQAGPGISGAISALEVGRVLSEARAMATRRDPPSADRLPVIPKGIFPLDALAACARAESWNDEYYQVTKRTGGATGDFVVTVATPPSLYRGSKRQEFAAAKRRQKRENRGGATESETYDPFSDLRTWSEYVGQHDPVVRLSVVPRIGQTTGSAVGNTVAAVLVGSSYRGSYVYEFKDDLKGCLIFRDGTRQRELRRMLYFQNLDFQTIMWSGSHSGSDVARCGLVLLSPGTFAPTGTQWPRIEIQLTGLERPEDSVRFALPRETVERFWLDFEPLRKLDEAAAQELLVAE